MIPRRPVERLLMAAVLAGAALSGIAAEPLTATQVRDILEKSTTYRSADGLTVVVGGRELPGADALRLCQFSTDVRKRLSALLSIPLEGESFATEIRVLSTEVREAASVACSVLPGGRYRVHIWIEGLGGVNPEDVGGALCGGLLRADALARGWRDAEGRTVQLGADPYPMWVGTGAARLLNVASRQFDAEHAIALLENGRLPAVSSLLSAEDSPACTDRALAAQIVAWLVSESGSQDGFAGLRERVLSSGGWAAVAGLPAAEGAVDERDAAWRDWLLHRKWVILTPGSSHPAFVRRVRGLLVLSPEPEPEESAESDANEEEEGIVEKEAARRSRIPAEAFAEGPLDPESLLVHSREPWAPEAAAAMSGQLQRALAGHGPDLLAVGTAYGAYFQGVMERRAPAELRFLLDTAEGVLRALEEEGRK